MLYDRVRRLALMRHLGRREIDVIVNAFRLFEFDTGTEIIRQGEGAPPLPTNRDQQ